MAALREMGELAARTGTRIWDLQFLIVDRLPVLNDPLRVERGSGSSAAEFNDIADDFQSLIDQRDGSKTSDTAPSDTAPSDTAAEAGGGAGSWVVAPEGRGDPQLDAQLDPNAADRLPEFRGPVQQLTLPPDTDEVPTQTATPPVVDPATGTTGAPSAPVEPLEELLADSGWLFTSPVGAQDLVDRPGDPGPPASAGPSTPTGPAAQEHPVPTPVPSREGGPTPAQPAPGPFRQVEQWAQEAGPVLEQGLETVDAVGRAALGAAVGITGALWEALPDGPAF